MTFQADRLESRLTAEPSPVGLPQVPQTANALSASANTTGGALAICWQQASQQGSRKVFVLVGVTGFEPVASAV
jgi:hypothetical protein